MDYLALAWIGMIAFGIIMYVLLGGVDLGIGILSIFFRKEEERDVLVSAILPVWDGNQTWLVFGAAALYGAFPLAFSEILPLMYIPILMMVIALLFRGVSFEFRLKAIKTKKFWNGCFFIGSLLATVAQGLILGTFVQGFQFPSNVYEWLNPFGFFCAFGLISGYVLLGADYLLIKTNGDLKKKSFRIASIAQYAVLISFILVSVWSPFLDKSIMQRWFDPSNMLYLAILPLTTGVFFLIHWYAIQKQHEMLPYGCVIGMFLMCYFGFIISSYPYIVPRSITFMQAAADRSSLIFMLVGACIMLPALLYYTYHSYKIFGGKVVNLGY